MFITFFRANFKATLLVIFFLFSNNPLSASASTDNHSQATNHLKYYGYYGSESFSSHSLEDIKDYTNIYMIDVPYDTKAVERALTANMTIILNLDSYLRNNLPLDFSERYSDELKKQIAFIYICDEPDNAGISSNELATMITTARQHFPYSQTIITYALKNGFPRIPSNLDVVAIDPYYYPDENGNIEEFNAYVLPRIKWALTTKKPIILIGQSHGLLQGYSDEQWQNQRFEWERQPSSVQQQFYVDAALKYQPIIGLLWFKYDNTCFAHTHTRDIIGAINNLTIVNYHISVGNQLLGRHAPQKTYTKIQNIAVNEPGTYACGVMQLPKQNKFISANPAIISINQNNLLTALRPGESIIQLISPRPTNNFLAKSFDSGELTKPKTFINNNPVEEINLKIGEKKKITTMHTDQYFHTVEILPAWLLGDTTIATIDNQGNIQGLKYGTTWLKITYQIGEKWLTVKVN